MERLRRLVSRKRSPSYEPLPSGGSEGPTGQQVEDENEKISFSWLEYMVFLLLGVAMLWAWNMFLAAAPYFQRRFRNDEWILKHFQSAILSVSTITNLGSLIVLTKLQSKASYPKRITSSLIINIFCFTLLALSTIFLLDVHPRTYLGFVLVMVLLASLATGLSQNGLFAYASSYGRAEYTQAIMTGQAVAGVLPCISQIVSVLSVSTSEEEGQTGQESSTSAFSYFLTATAVSAISLAAFLYLVGRNLSRGRAQRLLDDTSHGGERTMPRRHQVGLWTLFTKLHWLSGAVLICFGVTMIFPVFTQAIVSNRPPDNSPRLFEPAIFIPFSFLIWNSGDLIGRLTTLSPSVSLTSYPKTLFALALGRLIFVPLYELCNVGGRGAVIPSDFFYLVFVQLLFGITNGWLGSTCMIGAAEWVEPHEAEAAGGFMGLALVTGLTLGSLLSFLAAKG